jgi:hypothetical protein
MNLTTLQPIPVLADGGSRDGRLVLVDDHLVAVFVAVTPEEAGSAALGSGSGWYLEAGFGPCSSLLAVPPPIFSSLDEAQAWVREVLDAELVAKSR